MSEKRSFEKGKVIFNEGDSEFDFSRIVSGRVGIYRAYGTDREKHLSDRTAGDLIGEMGVIDYMRRSATAVALEDTELEVYSDAEFDDYLGNNPDKMFEILDNICDRIRELTKDNEEIRKDIKAYADAEGVNVEPSLLERIMNIVKGR